MNTSAIELWAKLAAGEMVLVRVSFCPKKSRWSETIVRELVEAVSQLPGRGEVDSIVLWAISRDFQPQCSIIDALSGMPLEVGIVLHDGCCGREKWRLGRRRP